MTKVLAIVPAYNEEESIGFAIEDLVKNAPEVDYVVVNDGSNDSTEKVCLERGYNIISLPDHLGLTGAFQAGIWYALENDYDYVVQFDADGQHVASYIGDLIEEARSSASNIVIGSRFVTKKKPLSPRMMGSMIISALIRMTIGEEVRDPTSGMRLYDKATIRELAGKPDYGPEPDTLMHLVKDGACFSEVQVDMRERVAGESYLSPTQSILYMLRTSLSILLAPRSGKE